MKKLKLFYWAIGALVLIFPAVSSSSPQVTYVINASAPYSYISGTNPITSWLSDRTPPGDDGYSDLPLGDFVFQFYGVSASTLRISTNGYMTFGAEGQLYFNYPIPLWAEPNALIAPFWTDLDLSVTGQVRWGIFGTSPSRQLVIEWFEVPSYDWGTEKYSFEVILYESTNKIKFQYLNVVSGTFYDRGDFSTVGVEDFDGTSGSQFSYNIPSLNNGLAIEFTPQAKRAIVDFDLDGKTDIAIYRSSTGVWWIAPSSGTPAYNYSWGGDASDIPVAGDYDGDGKTDIAIYDTTGGTWSVISSSTGVAYGVGHGGDPNDKVVPADYDGDGKTDIAIYRSHWGAWYIIPSSTGVLYGVGLGGDVTNDKPVPADYDGDGKTDIAIYRSHWGAWYIIPSSTGVLYGVGHGGDVTNDKPVPGDYDGDGKTDIAIYRSHWGAWYIIPSSTGVLYGVGYGGDPNDKPVPGDYDGDGKTDIAIYRSHWGAWYIIPSSTGVPYGVGWGGDASDIPVTTNPAL